MLEALVSECKNVRDLHLLAYKAVYRIGEKFGTSMPVRGQDKHVIPVGRDNIVHINEAVSFADNYHVLLIPRHAECPPCCIPLISFGPF